jgi:tetratricopeptide (TPR) repeat protein
MAVRKRHLAAACALALLAAAAFQAGRSAQPGPGPDPAPARAQRQTALAREFARAVALLDARRYQEAAGAWHRVLALAPRLPEAHVNMGFALLGLGQDAMARDFFGAALDLNKDQHNAYFGLALALDALGDRSGALGAMRTYVHLGKGEDRYRAKAEAAIRAWQARPGKGGGDSRKWESPPGRSRSREKQGLKGAPGAYGRAGTKIA